MSLIKKFFIRKFVRIFSIIFVYKLLLVSLSLSLRGKSVDKEHQSSETRTGLISSSLPGAQHAHARPFKTRINNNI